MNEHRITTIVLTMFLLLLTILVVVVPGALAKEYEGHHENLEIPNNAYWADNIAYFDTGDRFEFSVTELNGLSIDVYILDRGEYELYANNLYFTAEYSAENVVSTGTVNWTCPDDVSYFLVVDNKKNAHVIDAYAMEDVLVNLTWINKTEKEEAEAAEEMMDDFEETMNIWLMTCCGFVVIVLIVIIVVVVYYIKTKDSKKTANQFMYPPQPYRGYYPMYPPSPYSPYYPMYPPQQDRARDPAHSKQQDKGHDSKHSQQQGKAQDPDHPLQPYRSHYPMYPPQQHRNVYPSCPYLQQTGAGGQPPCSSGKPCPGAGPGQKEGEEEKESRENKSKDERITIAKLLRDQDKDPDDSED